MPPELTRATVTIADEDAIRTTVFIAGWPDTTADVLISKGVDYQACRQMFADALSGWLQ
jgi:hypothetical protein